MIVIVVFMLRFVWMRIFFSFFSMVVLSLCLVKIDEMLFVSVEDDCERFFFSFWN